MKGSVDLHIELEEEGEVEVEEEEEGSESESDVEEYGYEYKAVGKDYSSNSQQQQQQHSDWDSKYCDNGGVERTKEVPRKVFIGRDRANSNSNSNSSEKEYQDAVYFSDDSLTSHRRIRISHTSTSGSHTAPHQYQHHDAYPEIELKLKSDAMKSVEMKSNMKVKEREEVMEEEDLSQLSKR